MPACIMMHKVGFGRRYPSVPDRNNRPNLPLKRVYMKKIEKRGVEKDLIMLMIFPINSIFR